MFKLTYLLIPQLWLPRSRRAGSPLQSPQVADLRPPFAKHLDHEYKLTPSIKWLRLHEACQNGRSSLLGLGSFRTAYPPHHSPTAPSTFDNGYEGPATEASQYYPFLLECSHRSLEHCEGCVKPDTSQGHFRLCHGHSHYDQSGLHSGSII